MTRKLAAAFADPDQAELARGGLAELGLDIADIVTAPAAVARSDEGPIDQPVVLVVAPIDGAEDRVREVLARAGGRIVAESDV